MNGYLQALFHPALPCFPAGFVLRESGTSITYTVLQYSDGRYLHAACNNKYTDPLVSTILKQSFSSIIVVRQDMDIWIFLCRRASCGDVDRAVFITTNINISRENIYILSRKLQLNLMKQSTGK